MFSTSACYAAAEVAPKNYIYFSHREDGGANIRADKVLRDPRFSGAQIVYTWRSLEPVMENLKIDWQVLRDQAKIAQKNAYVNYSKFPVGAAALVDDGRIVSGCNVENASYGLTLCAECGLVSQLALTGGGRLIAFSCVGPEPGILLPCGRCRQLLQEHGGPELLVDHNDGPKRLKELLPDAFDGSNLT